MAKKLKLSDLQQDPNNLNLGTERGRNVIKQSLAELGAGRSILVDKNGYIIAGNKTAAAALDAGIEDVVIVETTGDRVVVVQRTDLDLSTDPKAKKLAVTDNRASELGLNWDIDALKVAADEIDISWLFTDEEIEGLDGWEDVENLETEGLTDEDEIPDPEDVETRVKKGDIWRLGRHRVMCGDSTVITDVERLMDGEKAVLLFTSPPYSDMRQYEEGTVLDIDHLSQIFEWPADFFAVNLGLKFKGTEVVPYWDDWISQAKKRDMKLLAWNVWDKTTTGSVASATNMFALTHEWIFVFGANRKPLNRIVPNQMDKYAQRHGDDFLDGANRAVRQSDGSMITTSTKTYTHHQLHSVIQQTPELGKIRKDHPATYPVGLPEQYILSFANTEEIVSDCFLGSGTTLIAAEKTGRTCYGMELSEKYCDVILKRWEDFTGQTAERI